MCSGWANPFILVLKHPGHPIKKGLSHLLHPPGEGMINCQEICPLKRKILTVEAV